LYIAFSKTMSVIPAELGQQHSEMNAAPRRQQQPVNPTPAHVVKATASAALPFSAKMVENVKEQHGAQFPGSTSFMEQQLRQNMLQKVLANDVGAASLSAASYPQMLTMDALGPMNVNLADLNLNDLEAAEAMLAVMAGQQSDYFNPIAGTRKKTKFNTRLYKTELCRSWTELGYCPYGDSRCQFAHGKSELRPVIRHKKYKTVKCKNFLAGYCPYGSRCCFIHSEEVESAPTPAIPQQHLEAGATLGQNTVMSPQMYSLAVLQQQQDQVSIAGKVNARNEEIQSKVVE